MPIRRRALALAATISLVLGVGAPSVAAPSPTPLPVPATMAALGDSITIAYDATRLLTAEPQYSWSTGTSTSVKSVYLRLKSKNKKLSAVNHAVSGAKSADLAAQASRVAVGTDLVTILIGANDACTSTVAGMTTTATFTTQIASAMDTLEAKQVDQVVVASIPNIYQLWDVARSSSTARLVWGLYGICQSMLADPSSTDPDDQLRRETVRTQVEAYNAALQAQCAETTIPCKYDGGAVFGTAFTLTDISKVDYFHPSVAGQAKLAATVYAAAGFPSGRK